MRGFHVSFAFPAQLILSGIRSQYLSLTHHLLSSSNYLLLNPHLLTHIFTLGLGSVAIVFFLFLTPFSLSNKHYCVCTMCLAPCWALEIHWWIRRSPYSQGACVLVVVCCCQLYYVPPFALSLPFSCWFVVHYIFWFWVLCRIANIFSQSVAWLFTPLMNRCLQF